MFVIALIFLLASVANAEIINGKSANIKDHPYQASLQRFYAHYCGGVILDENHVLTSAQCIGYGGDLSVRVGSDSKRKGGVVRNISKVKTHPKFVFIGGVPVYDIAVVKLNESLVFGDTIQAAKLFESGGELETGVDGVVTGYEDVGSDLLLSVTLPVIGKKVCNKAYKEWGGLGETQFCAGYYGAAGGQDICEGGLGSPMIVDNKIAGIVSWGYGCNEVEYPRVFTSISVLYEWIIEQTNEK